MKHCINILIFLLLMTACGNKRPNNKNVKTNIVQNTFDCKKGEMKVAWYEHGIDEPIPNIKGLQKGFIIVVDTNNKATNFISFEEDYLRRGSTELDTSELKLENGWENLTTKQKIEKVKQKRKSYLIQADSTHILNNQGQQQVWIINNTKDTVTIQMQDWFFICVLQAKTKRGQWCSIQYLRFSRCGNSYYFKHFPPNTANSFITKVPRNGDYKTKLRYKLLGADKFYCSNEFDGKINYCEFVEDSTSYNSIRRKPKPHSKLDSLIKLVIN